MEKTATRRDFLKTASLAGTTAMVAASLPKAAKAEDRAWDMEADVVALGSSGAAYGALSAIEAGAASAIVLEKAPFFGGTAHFSGGGHWTPCNYVMEEMGIEDTREKALAYLEYMSNSQSSVELRESYVDNGREFIKWTHESFGYEWTMMMGGIFQDYAPSTVPGFVPQGRSVAIDNVATVKAVLGEDVDYNPMAAFDEFRCVEYLLEQRGAQILLNTEAIRLVTDEEGAVVGVIALDESGNELSVKANRGVIVGTGGFDNNPDMCKAFLHQPFYTTMLIPTCTGDGHKMGMEIGADLANMAHFYGDATYLPAEGCEDKWAALSDSILNYNQIEGDRSKPNSLIVNSLGKRIGNESSAYGLFIYSFFGWDTTTGAPANVPAFLICDSDWTDHYSFNGTRDGVMPADVVKADTIEELAEVMGIDVVGLKAELEQFNANAKQGVDPVWHRGESGHDLVSGGDNKRDDLPNKCLGPVERAPFYCRKVYPGSVGTSGGLKINGKAQVMNVRGDVIPGLYACGCAASSPFGPSYPGGGSAVGSSCTMGYVAGRVMMGAEVL